MNINADCSACEAWQYRHAYPLAAVAGYGVRLHGVVPQTPPATPPCRAVLDASDERRVAAYATPEAAELETVYNIVHKLACVAQSFAATAGGSDGGGGAGGGDLRALQKQLRHLKLGAVHALAAARAPPEEQLEVN